MTEKTSAALDLINNIDGQVIVGKREQTELAVIALLTGHGHILFEDVPGTGKTMLARAIARSIKKDEEHEALYRRIQFTPDIEPSDIVGTTIVNLLKKMFEFRKGQIFADIVLADEINRGMPKAQSATLEAMGEGQVTDQEGVTHKLSELFVVLATQNPLEFEGVFPLPEAQRDRFLMRLSLGYPTEEEEIQIMGLHDQEHDPIDDIGPVVKLSDLLDEIAHVRRSWKKNPNEAIFVHEAIRRHIRQIVHATRDNHPAIRLGASVRGSLALQRAAKARAFLKGRDWVNGQDIQRLAVPILAHRIILKPDVARKDKLTDEQVIQKIVEKIQVPEEEQCMPLQREGK